MVTKASKSSFNTGRELPAESVLGDQFVMPAFVNPDVPIEWKTFQKYITSQPKEGMSEQLKELSTNSMLQTMYTISSTLARVCLTIAVGTASVEHSFSQMKMIKKTN